VRRTVCRAFVAGVIIAMATGAASAQTVPLAPPLAGVGFLVGSWVAGNGTVADTGEHSRVTFITNPSATAPSYRLTYALTNASTLGVDFEIEPPGATTFQPIATGTLQRSP